LNLDATSGHARSGVQRAAAALAVLLFLALWLASATVWVPTHDEGGTWFHAFAPPRLPRLPAEGIPIVELYQTSSATDARSTIDVIDSLSSMGGMHPPGYYVVLQAWGRLVGSNRILLAAPAALWGVVTLIAIGRVGRRVVPIPSSGSYAMLLLALSPWFIAVSNFARPYSLALCLAVLATDALLCMQPRDATGVMRRPERIAQLAFVVASIAGLYVVYHYVFVLLWQLALMTWLAWQRGPALRFRALKELFGIALVVALGFAPWIPRLLVHLELTGRRTHYFAGVVPLDQLPGAAGQLAASFALGEAARSPSAGALLLILILLGGATLPLLAIAYAEQRRNGGTGAVPAFWISLPLLPLLVLAADWWQGTHTLFISKTCFALLPLGILAVVWSWSTRRLEGLRGLRTVALLAWAALFATASISDIALRAANKAPFAAVAERIAASDDDAHLVVLSSELQGFALPFVLALRDAGVRHVRVGLASGPQLSKLVDRETRGPRRTISLVNLDVRYGGQAILTQGWGQRRVEQAAARAAAAGWQVAGPSPTGLPDALPSSSRKTLWIFGPLAPRSLGL
jgi:hypothetical protein